ncbi:MarR family winged helix-turn-helix transcriptional regulator [Streptomyces sp. NPDC004667]|uniref:MarR family winged helix-turn-helix transcriptional regulator n=1 Tax=Streptomyces sp. NPDC004667 TaxID=3154285 RepID=UPI0033B249B0
MTQHQPRDEPARTSAGQGRPEGMPEPDGLAQALREVLTLTQLARGVLAERLEMPLTNVEAVEHVMLAKGAGEPIGPAELARRLGVTTAAGTQSVNRLVSEGHMSRAPHPHDGRRQVLDVTDSGFRHVMGELAPLLDVLFKASDGLSDTERQGALAYLHNVARAYRTYLEAPENG